MVFLAFLNGTLRLGIAAISLSQISYDVDRSTHVRKTSSGRNYWLHVTGSETTYIFAVRWKRNRHGKKMLLVVSRIIIIIIIYFFNQRAREAFSIQGIATHTE